MEKGQKWCSTAEEVVISPLFKNGLNAAYNLSDEELLSYEQLTETQLATLLEILKNPKSRLYANMQKKYQEGLENEIAHLQVAENEKGIFPLRFNAVTTIDTILTALQRQLSVALEAKRPGFATGFTKIHGSESVYAIQSTHEIDGKIYQKIVSTNNLVAYIDQEKNLIGGWVDTAGEIQKIGERYVYKAEKGRHKAYIDLLTGKNIGGWFDTVGNIQKIGERYVYRAENNKKKAWIDVTTGEVIGRWLDDIGEIKKKGGKYVCFAKNNNEQAWIDVTTGEAIGRWFSTIRIIASYNHGDKYFWGGKDLDGHMEWFCVSFMSEKIVSGPHPRILDILRDGETDQIQIDEGFRGFGGTFKEIS